MNSFYDILVNISTGDDDIDMDKRKNLIPFRTTDRAIEVSKTGTKIFIHPGNYSGVDIETQSQNSFEYNIHGTGKNVIFNYVKHSGYINCTYKEILIKDLVYNCSNTESIFDGVNFCGGHKMICKGLSNSTESPLNEIEFQNCSFGINFQIHVESGMYKFTIKNCKFAKGIIPIIYVKSGDVELNVTYSNFSVPLVNNLKGCVYIHHNSCIFKDRIWIGNECSIFSSDDLIIMSGQRSIKKCQDNLVLPICLNIKNEIYKGIEVNTDDFHSSELKFELKKETEFVYVTGKNPLTIILPDEAVIQNSHYIQILNNSTILIINDLQYSNRIINIRYLFGRGWIFF